MSAPAAKREPGPAGPGPGFRRKEPAPPLSGRADGPFRELEAIARAKNQQRVPASLFAFLASLFVGEFAPPDLAEVIAARFGAGAAARSAPKSFSESRSARREETAGEGAGAEDEGQGEMRKEAERTGGVPGGKERSAHVAESQLPLHLLLQVSRASRMIREAFDPVAVYKEALGQLTLRTDNLQAPHAPGIPLYHPWPRQAFKIDEARGVVSAQPTTRPPEAERLLDIEGKPIGPPNRFGASDVKAARLRRLWLFWWAFSAVICAPVSFGLALKQADAKVGVPWATSALKESLPWGARADLADLFDTAGTFLALYNSRNHEELLAARAKAPVLAAISLATQLHAVFTLSLS